MKHVFIIPEPHLWDKSFKGRIGYPGEIKEYLHQCISLISACEGEKYVIFPGDIFHKEYKTFSGFAEAVELFGQINKLTNNRVYSCIGNHEITFSKDNPFWMMCCGDAGILEDYKSIPGYGKISESSGIRVVDTLPVGDTLFLFGHYGQSFSNTSFPNYRNVILISHNSILENEIVSSLENEFHRDVKARFINAASLRSSDFVPHLQNLKYLFVGHMHTAFSQYRVDETFDGIPVNFLLQYLGSLGRTNSAEVDNNDLLRIIPHFIFNPDLVEYSEIPLTLRGRLDTVDELEVSEAHDAYEARKPIEALKKSNIFSTSPEECISDCIQHSPIMQTIFSCLLAHEPIPELQELMLEAEHLEE